MDPLTIAAICTLVLKNEAATTAVPPGTNCAQIERDQRANAAKANVRVDDESDREAIGRVAYAEAANQGDRGIAAVVYTIINRVGSGRFGNSVNAVLNAPKQFEPVSRYGGDWRRLPPAPPAARARVDAIVGLALRGELADETGGALYFQNPRIVAARERAGLVSRGLTNFGGQRRCSEWRGQRRDHWSRLRRCRTSEKSGSRSATDRGILAARASREAKSGRSEDKGAPASEATISGTGTLRRWRRSSRS